MAILLLDNSNTLYNSYLKGWEIAQRMYEEEVSGKGRKTKGSRKKS